MLTWDEEANGGARGVPVTQPMARSMSALNWKMSVSRPKKANTCRKLVYSKAWIIRVVETRAQRTKRSMISRPWPGLIKAWLLEAQPW